MPDRTLKKFCRLSKYIEQIDKDFYTVFEDLCLTHLLKPARGSNGITMIYPKEKSYREKIINAAYSKNPEEAVDMIKALILQDYYPTPTSFEGTVVNLLNHKVEIEEVSDKHIKLSKDLKLEKDEAFVPMGYRENMAVYHLSGKGHMPTEGTSVRPEKPQKKKGGFLGMGESFRQKLNKVLEDSYAQQIKKTDNVYAKKVCMQLELLFTKGGEFEASDKKSIVKYLGNSEFSDSYLLDIYCEKYSISDNIFDSLLKSIDMTCNGNTFGGKQFTNCDYKATKQRILDELRQIIGGPTDAESYNKKKEYNDETRLNNIQSPIEIRERVHTLYTDDKPRIGKDLFIVFTNVYQDLWMSEIDLESAKSQFRNFVYIVNNVFNNPEDLVKQEFDIARDLTLYGNLLKSDVFKFDPLNPAQGYTVPIEMPSPLDMNKFSLSGYIESLNKKSLVSGGNPTIEALLRG